MTALALASFGVSGTSGAAGSTTSLSGGCRPTARRPNGLFVYASEQCRESPQGGATLVLVRNAANEFLVLFSHLTPGPQAQGLRDADDFAISHRGETRSLGSGPPLVVASLSWAGSQGLREPHRRLPVGAVPIPTRLGPG